MNILHVNTYTSGGAGLASVRLHEALLQQGVDSHYLSLQGTSDKSKEMYSFAANSGIFFKIQNFTYRAIHQLRLLPYGRPYIDSLHTPYDITEHPLYPYADIIHLHWVTKFLDWHSFFMKNKKPIVWTMHDMAPFSGGFHCMNDVHINNATHLIARQEQTKMTLLHNQYITPVGPSQWQVDNASHSKSMSQFKGIQIPNCLPSLHFQNIGLQYKNELRLKYKFNKEDKILFFVGDQLGLERKGFKYLYEALRMIQQPMTLMVVGHGFDNSFFEGLNHHNICNMGPVYESYKIAELYQISDAVVSPSIEDNLPNIMLESFACGIPFIGFPIGGIKEYVVTGYNGHLCSSISSHDLAGGINDILFNSSDIDYSANCVSTYSRNFTPEIVAQQYIRLYHQILSSKNAV